MILKNKIITVVTTIAMLISFTAQAQTESGKASFYSKKSSGRRTASGERLHHDSLTCAHRTYPFGTLLLVTNPENGKHVIVKVTDRGPYVKGRVIDLSMRAAKELGIMAKGIAPVLVEEFNPSIIPFKPAEIFSKPELDLSTTDEDASKPIWIELRDHMKKKQQKEKEKEKKKR